MPSNSPGKAPPGLPPGAWPWVVFDLDGTLLVAGSAEGILWHAALCEAWPERPGASPGPVWLERCSEPGLGEPFLLLEETWPEERRERARQAHRRLSAQARRYAGLTAMPGAAEVLEGLRRSGQRLIVATNATRSGAERALEGLGLAQSLEAVLGVDPQRPESKAVRLRRWAEEQGWPEGVLVGDSPSDLEAAGAARLAAVQHLGSGADPDPVGGAAAQIQRLAELPAWLGRRRERVAELARQASARGPSIAVDGGPPGAAERWSGWISALAGLSAKPWELAGWRLGLGPPFRPGTQARLDLSNPLDPILREPGDPG